MRPKPLYLIDNRCFVLRKIIILFFFFTPLLTSAQIAVEGVVIDSLTGSSMPFVKVRFSQGKTFASTDTSGYFRIESPHKVDTLKFYYIGYRPFSMIITDQSADKLEVQLVESSTNLTAIIIQAGENPAYEILRQIKAHKAENNPEKLASYECEVYNKMQFNINNLSGDFDSRSLFKKFDFIMNYIDTVNGERYLPVLLTESISDYYYKNNPAQKKEIIRATRITGVDNLELGQFTGDMYQNVNILSLIHI